MQQGILGGSIRKIMKFHVSQITVAHNIEKI